MELDLFSLEGSAMLSGLFFGVSVGLVGLGQPAANGQCYIPV